MRTNALRELRFIIIGAQKCGTTSLWEYLSAHPDVVRSKLKEVHYFDDNYDKGVDWYREQLGIADVAPKSVLGRFRRHSRPVHGEASPYYLFHPHAATRIANDAPHARLIVTLRDPVERAWSHYNHAVRHGWEPLTFDQALDAEEKRLGNVEERMREDPTLHAFEHRRYSYVARGHYARQLRDWFERFPREQFHLVDADDLAERPAATYAATCDFVGLRRPDGISFDRHYAGGHGGSMSTEARERLEELFRQGNDELRTMTGGAVGAGWSS